MKTDLIEDIPKEELSNEVFSCLTANQLRYVQLWIRGGKGQSECYREAYRWNGKNEGSLRSCAHTCHTKPKIQRAIAYLAGIGNREALLSRQEKREALARIVRAHSPQQRAVNPNSPDLKESLLHAIKIDNEMAGDNAPTEITGELTLGAILMDLRTPSLVPERAVAPLPIPAAGGGFGELPGRTGSRPAPEDHENGNGNGHRAALELLDPEDGIEAFKRRMRNGHAKKGPFSD